MTREDKTFHLRLPAKVYAKLSKDAKANKRSLNAHLNAIVEQHLERK